MRERLQGKGLRWEMNFFAPALSVDERAWELIGLGKGRNVLL